MLRQMGCHFACASATLLVRVPANNYHPHAVHTKTRPNTRRTTHQVAIGSGQSQARLNGGRRDSSAAAATHHETGRHWAFGHATFRGWANQKNEKQRLSMSLSQSETRGAARRMPLQL